MTTFSNLPAAPTRISPAFDSSAWRAWFARLAAAWTARREARAEDRLDGYFRHQRDERERFLSKATDHYQLEHLERAWERRHSDLWRVS